jgi:hypothetical protein
MSEPGRSLIFFASPPHPGGAEMPRLLYRGCGPNNGHCDIGLYGLKEYSTLKNG